MNDEQRVGIAELDAQHEEINALAASLRELIAGNERRHLIDPTLKRLSQLLATHFEYEELLMQMVNYADLPQHRKMHRGILKLFDDYFAQPAADGADERGRTIGDRVLGHVMEHDAQMTRMVRDYLKTFRSAPEQDVRPPRAA